MGDLLGVPAIRVVFGAFGRSNTIGTAPIRRADIFSRSCRGPVIGKAAPLIQRRAPARGIEPACLRRHYDEGAKQLRPEGWIVGRTTMQEIVVAIDPAWQSAGRITSSATMLLRCCWSRCVTPSRQVARVIGAFLRSDAEGPEHQALLWRLVSRLRVGPLTPRRRGESSHLMQEREASGTPPCSASFPFSNRQISITSNDKRLPLRGSQCR